MIPVNEPALGEEESAAVAEAVRSGWISSASPALEEFERSWAAYCGRGYGIAVSSGTMALRLAVDALDLEPGDEIIMPSFTIISCAIAVVDAGAIPVLVDSDPGTWTMDVTQIEARITGRTKAIMPVHIYGHPVDMAPVLGIAAERGLAVIEDAAEAHGAMYETGDGWVRCGSMGSMSCFSFYANKLLTTGEGGMIVTDDIELAERLRLSRDLYFEPGRRFRHERLGWNARLSGIQAALGLAQVDKMDRIVDRKREIAASYASRLADLPWLQLPPEEPWARSVYWMYGIVLDDSTRLDAAGLIARLGERGIESRPFFLGMHEQPASERLGMFIGESFPVAERLARRGLYLPSGLGLTEEQIDRVAAELRESLA